MNSHQELFRAYLDESEDSATHTYVVGGFVGKTEVWGSVENKWLECLPVEITSFHTTDCFSGRKAFEGISIGRRIELLDKLTDVIVAHEIRLIGHGIDSNIYRGFAPKAKENDFLGNKYAAPFGGVVQLACEAMGNTPTPDTMRAILEHGEDWERCAFFIESNEYSPSANRTLAGLRRSTDLWFRGRIGTDAYGTKSGPAAIPLLQVADLGAFLAAKHMSQGSEGKISWKQYYEKLKSAGRVYRMVQANEYSLKALHESHEELKKEAD